MDAIARSINVALPDAFQAQEEVAIPLRFGLYQLIRKTTCRFARDSGNRSPRPLARGPGGIREEPRGMTGLIQAMSETFQIGFGPTSLGMTAANQSNR